MSASVIVPSAIFADVMAESWIFIVVTESVAKSPSLIDPSKILEELTASGAILSAVTAPSKSLVESTASSARSTVSIEPSDIATPSIVPGPVPPTSAPHTHSEPFHFKICPAELGAPVGRG